MTRSFDVVLRAETKERDQPSEQITQPTCCEVEARFAALDGCTATVLSFTRADSSNLSIGGGGPDGMLVTFHTVDDVYLRLVGTDAPLHRTRSLVVAQQLGDFPARYVVEADAAWATVQMFCDGDIEKLLEMTWEAHL